MPPSLGRRTPNAKRLKVSKESESMVETSSRLEKERQRISTSRAGETDVERDRRLADLRERASTSRAGKWLKKKGSAFFYDPSIKYESDKTLSLGDMSFVCEFCLGKKWKEEASGMCCASGKMRLPVLCPPPEPLRSLLLGEMEDSKHFLDNIRKYNAAFQMTSFGGTVCKESGYMPTFKVQGQVYHLIGSILPVPDEGPKFLQLYFLGNSDEETQVRSKMPPNVKSHIISLLQEVLHLNNPYVRELKSVVDWMGNNNDIPEVNVVIEADRRPAGEHRGRYNSPVTNEIAVVLVDQDVSGLRDIVIKTKEGGLRRISETHRAYDCLQYPLMFCRGEDGYMINIRKIDLSKNAEMEKTVSCMDFYAYRMMVRDSTNYLLYYRALGNQFWVDMYAKIETERLNFIRYNQTKLRVENYIHLQDAIARDGRVDDVGQMIILPSSFTGGPRYMHERMLDAMSYVQEFGRPDLFITFTCNSQWKEIQDELFSGQRSEDRYDIVSRVFHLKMKKMMQVIDQQEIFGRTKCFTYSIEWQKRGLPHAHILVWLAERIRENDMDKLISAEIPDEEEDPILYRNVLKSMIHGPCGALNLRCVCMKHSVCSKKFPKRFVLNTQTDVDGYPMYRRRSPEDGGRSFKLKLRSGVECVVDNKWVVPYSPILSRIFNAHINVECGQSVKAIKYLFKYVNKGSDQATIAIKEGLGEHTVQSGISPNNKDEVLLFQTGRYVSSAEATWRILGFPIHGHKPTVTKLDVHLENGQRVYFVPDNINDVLQKPARSTLLSFFELCRKDAHAKTLLYREVPKYYTLNQATKKWSVRKQGEAIGRMYSVHPNNAECYYLRMLLNTVPGPTSFEDLRTVNGELCESYQIACVRLGLLEDDNHWKNTLNEAALCEAPKRLRYLFAVMLAVCQISEPKILWEEQKENLSEDILYHARSMNDNPVMPYDEKIFNKTLLYCYRVYWKI